LRGQAEQLDTEMSRDRAEHCSMPGGPDSSRISQITQQITRCPTRNGPVARYVECPDKNVYSQNLTCDHLTGTDVRAEQQLDIHRLIVGGGCQAEQVRAELDKKFAANVEAQKID
jgi:hypothetical protein